MFGKLKKSLRFGAGKKDLTEEEGLEALRKARAGTAEVPAAQTNETVPNKSAADTEAPAPSGDAQPAVVPVEPTQPAPQPAPAPPTVPEIQQAQLQAQMLAQQQAMMNQALMGNGMFGMPGFAPPGFGAFGGPGAVPTLPQPQSADAASVHSVGVPPKSVPEGGSRSESVASSKKHPGKILRKKMVKSLSRSPSLPALNHSSALSDVGDLSGGEKAGEEASEEKHGLSEHEKVHGTDASPAASSQPLGDMAAPTAASASVPTHTGPVKSINSHSKPESSSTVVATASAPSLPPPSSEEPHHEELMLQSSDDDEAPMFQEVTDVPPRNLPEAKIVSSSSSSVSQSPVMVEVLPSPREQVRREREETTYKLAPHFASNSPVPKETQRDHYRSVTTLPSRRSETAPPDAAPSASETAPALANHHQVDEKDIFSPSSAIQLSSEQHNDNSGESNRPQGERRVLRRLVADRFVTIFSSTQYFGEVKGLKRVTVFDENVEDELSSSLVVAVRPNVGSHLYFDNVQLCPDDIHADCVVGEDGCIETTMEMFSIKDGGRWAFVEKERDAAKLLQYDPMTKTQPVSVYVTERQALMCRDGAAKRLASLVVVWRPTSSTTKDDECPIHHKLKELYDPAARGLACALCSASEGRKMLVLSEIVSPHLQSEVAKVVEAKKTSVQSAMRKQLIVHQRMLRARNRTVQQVNEQFDALVALIESKRREFIDEIDSKQKNEMDEIEHGIDAMTDVTRLLDAARAGLKCSTPLSPPQMATIATAIKVKIPPATEVTPQIGKVTLNLSDISSRVQRISVDVEGSSNTATTPLGRSPTKNYGNKQRQARNEDEDSVVVDPLVSRQPQVVSGSRNRNTSTARPPPNSASLQACRPGTSLFNFPLHEMPNDRGIEWRLRIEDSGDWLGIGVGVGGQLEEWARGGIFDLHHLWIVPSSAPRTVTLRVTPISNGNMKLTIHRASGQQLDDGRIPHWHCSRTAFPQVSFAGRQGRVTMLSTPSTL